MQASAKIRKTCPAGHVFYKSSTCRTCPQCERLRQPREGFLANLAAPARRALEREGITSIGVLSQYSAQEILALHGVGPSALPKLRKSLDESGLAFRGVGPADLNPPALAVSAVVPAADPRG